MPCPPGHASPEPKPVTGAANGLASAAGQPAPAVAVAVRMPRARPHRCVYLSEGRSVDPAGTSVRVDARGSIDRISMRPNCWPSPVARPIRWKIPGGRRRVAGRSPRPSFSARVSPRCSSRAVWPPRPGNFSGRVLRDARTRAHGLACDVASHGSVCGTGLASRHRLSQWQSGCSGVASNQPRKTRCTATETLRHASRRYEKWHPSIGRTATRGVRLARPTHSCAAKGRPQRLRPLQCLAV